MFSWRRSTGWFSDPLVKVALQRQIELINERFAERLAAAVSRALPELEEIAMQPAQGAPTYEVKVRAIQAILDRCPATARATGQADPPELLGAAEHDRALDRRGAASRSARASE